MKNSKEEFNIMKYSIPLQEQGISFSTINQWSTGRKRPSYEKVLILSKIANKPVLFLLLFFVDTARRSNHKNIKLEEGWRDNLTNESTLTASDFALNQYWKKLRQVGIPEATASSWTIGKRRPTFEGILILSHITKIPTKDLIAWYIKKAPHKRSAASF